MVPWIERPVLEMDEARPLADAPFPPEAIDSARRLLGAIAASIPPKARMLAYLARVRTWNRFHSEMSAMADRAGVDWRDLMLANLSYDLLLASLGCSTIALPTADGPVLARNMDWFPEVLLARASYLVRVCRNSELHFASAGWPGGVGVVTGLSARGFAVALNAVLCPESICKTGYPVLLHLRCVVEDARDFDHALAMLRDQRLTAAGLFTLVGSDNLQRVVIERSSTRHALRWPKDGEALLATNDYRSLFPPKEGNGLEIYRTTCHRYAALKRMFARWSPERTIADTQLLYALSDPEVIQEITAQHVLIRPRRKEMRLFVPRRLLTTD
ncbi:MAG: C45 family autoproteolytic acyltransferase/hydrolase [Gemmataceae bacterium]|nr:C45 family autoproteolytic acyltransferase/hydrolase [Gemmataceae bacterium]MCI0740676.1 C45 family autoproteolytic acyltransferase/hydrolase [Gemmataceae bacterium]